MPVSITPAALNHLKELTQGRFGIKIGVQTKGCSGLSYTMSYVDQKEPYDEEVVLGDVRLFIDPKALLFIIGTSIDSPLGATPL